MCLNTKGKKININVYREIHKVKMNVGKLILNRKLRAWTHLVEYQNKYLHHIVKNTTTTKRQQDTRDWFEKSFHPHISVPERCFKCFKPIGGSIERS